MSGGSMSYIYEEVEKASTLTYDPEIKELLHDLSILLHDEEWYRSADYSKQDYRKSLFNFKEKWFKKAREDRLMAYIDSQILILKDDIKRSLFVDEN